MEFGFRMRQGLAKCIQAAAVLKSATPHMPLIWKSVIKEAKGVALLDPHCHLHPPSIPCIASPTGIVFKKWAKLVEGSDTSKPRRTLDMSEHSNEPLDEAGNAWSPNEGEMLTEARIEGWNHWLTIVD